MDKETKKYLVENKYADFKSSAQLDMAFIRLVSDWVAGKVSDKTLANICEMMEGDPLHHGMVNKIALYYGIDMSYPLMISDKKEIENLKKQLKEWYEKL